MKKGILTILTVLGIATFGFAQSLEFESYDAVTEMNSQSINDYGAKAIIKNISNVDVLVLCKRVEYGQNWCAFDSNYFCWDLCYGNNVNQSQGGWTLQPGQLSDPNYFGAHAYSKNDGSSCMDSVRYVFYVDNDVNDSISAVFKFVSSPTFGVEENNLKTATAYPNPARHFFFVEFNNQPDANTTIEVYNLLGSKVKSILAKSKKVEVNVSGLKSGIYLYTISKDGNAVETRKIMVNN